MNDNALKFWRFKISFPRQRCHSTWLKQISSWCELLIHYNLCERNLIVILRTRNDREMQVSPLNKSDNAARSTKVTQHVTLF